MAVSQEKEGGQFSRRREGNQITEGASPPEELKLTADEGVRPRPSDTVGTKGSGERGPQGSQESQDKRKESISKLGGTNNCEISTY